MRRETSLGRNLVEAQGEQQRESAYHQVRVEKVGSKRDRKITKLSAPKIHPNLSSIICLMKFKVMR